MSSAEAALASMEAGMEAKIHSRVNPITTPCVPDQSQPCMVSAVYAPTPLRMQMSSAEAALASMEAGMEAKKQQWLPELKRMVETINASFSTNFAEIGCAGGLVGAHA